jgi:hypothetical protein
MKKLLFALAICLGLSTVGCVVAYTDPPVYQTGTVEFCDLYGCRYVNAPYYYDSDGAVVYWDAHFGYWIGPNGYLAGGVWHRGFWPGYHSWYHAGFYHGFHGGFHGGGYHGGFHGGHR